MLSANRDRTEIVGVSRGTFRMSRLLLEGTWSHALVTNDVSGRLFRPGVERWLQGLSGG